MINVVLIGIVFFILLIAIFVISSMTIENYLSIGLIYFIYLIITKELFHFIDKRNLVTGDLIFIKFKGKYRKAYIKEISTYTNKAQLEFEDTTLNTRDILANNYPLSRIIIPDYMGKMAKILYSEVEGKKK